MRLLRLIPLFLALFIVYNALTMTGINLSGQIFNLHLISGASWTMSIGDVLLMIGIFALYVELVKSTSTQSSTMIEHTFSLLVFIGFLIEFIVVKEAATSTFVLLMLMSLLDVMAGFTITVSTAMRDVNVVGGVSHL
ncbi:conserved membrane hypothetical protein [Gammaproteobacteria bacterium]